jgi:hypothetical protein
LFKAIAVSERLSVWRNDAWLNLRRRCFYELIDFKCKEGFFPHGSANVKIWSKSDMHRSSSVDHATVEQQKIWLLSTIAKGTAPKMIKQELYEDAQKRER